MPDDQHDDRANDRDKQAIEVEAGYPHVSELIEKPSTYHGADDSEHDVQQQTFAGFVHDFAADKTLLIDPRRPRLGLSSKFSLCECVDHTLVSDPTGSWVGTMAELSGFTYTLKPVFATGAS